MEKDTEFSPIDHGLANRITHYYQTLRKMKVESETHPAYNTVTGDDQAIIDKAIEIIDKKVTGGAFIQGPEDSKDFFRIKLQGAKREEFYVLFLTVRHCTIALEKLFSGTIDGCSVYSRVIIQRALELNAAAIIVAHNHPSGDPMPSRSDKALTKKLQEATKLMDIVLLDHFVCGENETISFARSGWL